MRPRVVLVLAIAAIIVGSGMLVPAAYARLHPNTSGPAAAAEATPAAPAAPLPPPAPLSLAAAPINVTLGGDSFLSWALLDRTTGKISGSANSDETSTTESMIKAWIVSDYLRGLGDQQPPAYRLQQASTAIRDSNDDATESLFWAAGGRAVIDRLIKMCRLKNTKAVVPPGQNVVWWAYTRMSARDAVRMGQCIKSGKAAGPKWTKWVLNEMTKVRGTTAAAEQHERSGGGRWGIIDGLPAEIVKQEHVGIKNGWTPISADGEWHVSCLAVADNWILAVMTRYPIHKGLNYGANVCANVASQLVTPQPGAALKVPQSLDRKPSDQR